MIVLLDALGTDIASLLAALGIFGFAIAIGLRYAHGRGQVLGLAIPAQYDPSSITLTGINGKINEISLNLGAKVSF